MRAAPPLTLHRSSTDPRFSLGHLQSLLLQQNIVHSMAFIRLAMLIVAKFENVSETA